MEKRKTVLDNEATVKKVKTVSDKEDLKKESAKKKQTGIEASKLMASKIFEMNEASQFTDIPPPSTDISTSSTTTPSTPSTRQPTTP